MNKQINLDRDKVYKELQKQIKEYTGPIEFGVVKIEAAINVYSDRGIGHPFLIHPKYLTWGADYNAEDPNPTEEGYAKYIFNSLLKKCQRHGTKINLPSRKKIIQSKQMPKLRAICKDVSDIDIAKWVIYMFVTKQTCKECDIGYIVCDVNSWEEHHECFNCGYSFSVN